jgi:hypothetical protein
MPEAPAQDVTVAPIASGEPGIPEAMWQDFQGRWNAIESLEASIETARIRLEGLQAELNNAGSRTLTTDEKLHALNADVVMWTKAKSRLQYVLPKVREFVHRANWATGVPEKKQLEELFRDQAHPPITLARADQLREQLENLLKDRQVLLARGVSVSQECENITGEVQGALRTLQSNAAARARESRNAARGGGKFMKDVRRMSGLK